jgi:hypothetical protein
MLRKVLLVLAAAAIVAVCVGGCKKQSGEPEPPEPEQEVIKTPAEFEAEAAKEITKENMAAELEKLEKEIEEDVR